MHFAAGGGESSSIRPDGSEIIPCVSIDCVLVDYGIGGKTLLKMDIEGAELEALKS
ncbi:MAG: FkbM family methyltransferase [Oscillospiraceae bacterium]|nr:FkbM family methyltransferase [Oscillospiraceae bacterium]